MAACLPPLPVILKAQKTQTLLEMPGLENYVIIVSRIIHTYVKVDRRLRRLSSRLVILSCFVGHPVASFDDLKERRHSRENTFFLPIGFTPLELVFDIIANL